MSDVFAPQPVKTKTNGDVVASIVDSAGTNKAAVSAAGAVKVDNSAVTQPVSGTVTANIGTSGSLALDASVTGLEVTQGSTTSGQKGMLNQGAVTTGSPSYTTAQTSPLSLTTAGALRTDASATTQPVSGTVTANAGTGTLTVGQGTASNLNAAVVGNVASGATDAGNPVKAGGVFNTSAPTLTNAQRGDLQLDSSANLKVNIAAGSSSGAVAQSSTTSGETGLLVQGAVTTAAPSYTTAQTNPLSLTTAGLLRVDGTGGTFPISGSLTANQSVNVAQINGVTPLMGNGVSGTGATRVTIASDSTGQVTLAAGAATIGALTANQSVNNAQVNGVATSVGNGVSGTGVQRVTLASDSTGQVALATGSNTIGALTANQSVNVAQMNGVATAMGSGTTSTGTQRVVLATDQTSIPTTIGLSGTVVDDYLTSAALAAGATVTLDSTQIASGTGSLVEATVSASVALKAQLGTWDGTTFTVKRTFFVAANTPFSYIPQRYDEIQKATGATAKFRWSITNMDNANAADVYCSTTYWR